MTLLHEVATALLNAGGGRARIQTLGESQKQLTEALGRVREETLAAIQGSTLESEHKAETAQLIGLALSKVQSIAGEWGKEADRCRQLEQPIREESAKAYLAGLDAILRHGLLARLQRAAKAALQELKSP